MENIYKIKFEVELQDSVSGEIFPTQSFETEVKKGDVSTIANCYIIALENSDFVKEWRAKNIDTNPTPLLIPLQGTLVKTSVLVGEVFEGIDVLLDGTDTTPAYDLIEKSLSPVDNSTEVSG